MLNKIKRKNKKGQVGETITWIVATVVIIITLIVSIFIASFYFGNNRGISYEKQVDVLTSKSFFSYLATNNSDGKIIYEQIKEEKSLNSFNGNLATDVFQKLYEKEYKEIWLGISNYGEGILGGTWNGEENGHFGSRPKMEIVVVMPGGTYFVVDAFSNMFKIEKNSVIELLTVNRIKSGAIEIK